MALFLWTSFHYGDEIGKFFAASAFISDILSNFI